MILVPDESMDFVRCRHVVRLADVNNRDWRTFIIEWPKRIHSFKPASTPPRSGAKDMPNIGHTFKGCRPALKKAARRAVAECAEKIW